MKTTKTIKRENLQSIIDTHHKGIRRKLEIALGKKDGALSRYFSESKSAREIGKKLCRQVETLHSLKESWMIEDHAISEITLSPEEWMLVERYRSSNQDARLKAIQELQQELPAKSH